MSAQSVELWLVGRDQLRGDGGGCTRLENDATEKVMMGRIEEVIVKRD